MPEYYRVNKLYKGKWKKDLHENIEEAFSDYIMKIGSDNHQTIELLSPEFKVLMKHEIFEKGYERGI